MDYAADEKAISWHSKCLPTLIVVAVVAAAAAAAVIVVKHSSYFIYIT